VAPEGLYVLRVYWHLKADKKEHYASEKSSVVDQHGMRAIDNAP